MLASTRPWRGLKRHTAAPGSVEAAGARADSAPTPRGRVAVLTGCVQDGLFRRVNEATVRVLEANGFTVLPVPGQGCCGALHAHGGDLARARALAQDNVRAFDVEDIDHVVVNAAGCGATMKEYGHLLGDDGAPLAGKVRDLAELLAEVGVRAGAAVPCSVAVDHPCHLLHAQGIRQAPLDLLAAVPGVDVRVVDDADECCGGAGIYGITHPELGGRIGGDKVAAVRRCAADVVATPNPGCMMQIGGGLLLDGASEGVVHPVELLDESYRRAGFYGSRG